MAPGHRAVYKLKGVVTHKSVTSTLGHYMSYIKSLHDPTQWFCADDSQVKLVPSGMYVYNMTL